MDFCTRNCNAEFGGRNKREQQEAEGRASDDDENGSTRKKLRLSKEQSAFLEESFKEHTTLNPKQKLALAKQLNLRPRQVEVWFQNRRARTKLKQTEVDCEYLKRCCETLTEENRRLQKELQELRALKTSQPFYMQLPATTLTMCPSCERVATNSTTTNQTTTVNNNASQIPVELSLSKPRILPFPNGQAQAHQIASS
ncbi:Homeobox-leucine zipper protein HAT14 [Glycine soja]|nr:Homeobox-leucine zipper protein HAT14 [Glycine soja]